VSLIARRFVTSLFGKGQSSALMDFDYEGHPPSLPKGGLGLGILDSARRTCQSSDEGQNVFLSRSAWLIESHWSSCRLPGKTKSSASRLGNHDARSGSKTWPASNFAEATAMRLALSPTGFTAMILPGIRPRSS
jgi:hypothetical protein